MNALDSFTRRLRAGEVIVIDGGMGVELRRRGVAMHPVAWAAPAVLEHYAEVCETHQAFLRAGAKVLIANTFMASHHALREAGMLERVEEINRRSVHAAIQAREAFGDRDVLVAGAMFGAEPDDQDDVVKQAGAGGVGDLGGELREQAHILAQAGADLIALEMIQTTQWGVLAARAAAAAGLPVWLGVTQGPMVSEDGSEFTMPLDPPGQIGEQVRLIVTQAREADVLAVNVMHTALDRVPAALEEVRVHWQGPLGAYPHHGVLSHDQVDFVPHDIKPAAFLSHARRWVEGGVQLVGGCCGIGPEHIEVLGRELPSHVPGLRDGE